MSRLVNILVYIVFLFQLYTNESAWLRGKKVGYVDINSPDMLEIYNKGKEDASLSPSIAIIPELNWDNIVVIIMTYNDETDSNILKKNFNSWIKRIQEKNLDIIVVTDHNDERTYEEILPYAGLVSPAIHLHRSNAINEGKKARSKTIDSLSYAYEKFQDDVHKHIFLKIDPDTFVLPEILLKHLKKVHEITYPLPG